MLGACTGKLHPVPQYWQRVNASSSLYTRGEKAKDLLRKDLHMCESELEELERLKEVKDPIKYAYNDRILPTPALDLKGKNTSGETKALISGANTYTDFDGCMYTKGWERTARLPYSRQSTGNLVPRRNLDTNNLKTLPPQRW